MRKLKPYLGGEVAMSFWTKVLPQGYTIVSIDLSPGSDAYDEALWSDPLSTSAYIDGLLGDRKMTAGIILAGSVIMAWANEPQRSSDLATTAQHALVITQPGTQVRWPGMPAIVHLVEPNRVLVRELDSGFAFAFNGIEPALVTGQTISAGDALGASTSLVHDSVIGDYFSIQFVPDHKNSDSQLGLLTTQELFEARRAVIEGGFDSLGLKKTSGPLSSSEIVALRDKRLARSQRAYYRVPPALVRAKGVWMYDENGGAYLDTINNVTHVGHSNSRITRAASRQLAKLNTNSRFVYEGLAQYADRLVATLPDPLEVVFFVCTGSEANDLALRISRQFTSRRDVVILDGAYHGNTTAVMEISPNRYKGPGGRGKPETTHELETPNLYRGSYRYGDTSAGANYAADASLVFEGLSQTNSQPAAFIAESLMGTAGNVVLPDGYLEKVFATARSQGALCVSDEVQVGAGRFGNHYWGFEDQGVVPDIVTMGKPIGNGHPMAAVVTTREIAQAFDDGVKYFNTFAGNPVSCAIGMEVLQIIDDENLQDNAKNVGTYLLASLTELKARHELIGDVRGKGLYLGVELVRDRENQEPAKKEAAWISEELLKHGVISYPTGVYDNVLKVKPPMVFDKSNADFFIEGLDQVFASPRPLF
jgi:4-aminobutyrate aminotransferase-like enzyme